MALTAAQTRGVLARRALFESYKETLANTGCTKPYDIIMETIHNLESKGYRITKTPQKGVKP